MTWGVTVTGCLLLHGVINIMYFCVSPVFLMPMLSRLVGWFPLHVFLVLLSLSKLIFLNVTLLLLVSGPNRQMSGGSPKVLPPIIVVSVASALCT